MVGVSGRRPETPAAPLGGPAGPPRASTLAWAVLVGVLAGLVGGAFQIGVDRLAEARARMETAPSDADWAGWWAPVTFGAGLLFVALAMTRGLAPEAAGSGVQEIEGALEGKRPARWWRVLPVKFFGGLASLGSGLLAGREGPTIQLGGNVGALVADVGKVRREEGNILIAAGAGAGLAAAFNAPLAGVLFIIEEMRDQFRPTHLAVQAVMLATIAATMVVRWLMGPAPDLPVVTGGPLALETAWLFALLGLAVGVVGLVFNRLLVMALDAFADLPLWARHATGLWLGGFIGLVGWLHPDMVGSGDLVLPRVMDEQYGVRALIVLCLARFSLTLMSYGAGAPGGIFSPMLAIGALAGAGVGTWAAGHWPAGPEPTVLAVCGMAALFAATVQAPATGIVLTLEMTNDVQVVLPLMITCLVAWMTSRAVGNEPIYSTLLARTLARAERGTTMPANRVST